jgi:hypothetical protein
MELSPFCLHRHPELELYLGLHRKQISQQSHELKHNRSLKVAVQGPDFMAHPLYIQRFHETHYENGAFDAHVIGIFKFRHVSNVKMAAP